ncbi:MAG: alpha/beta hydrolase [Polyangiaceae bacterium]|nr:alpha/beta hydrolase [Polyangiaceae bacterium]
MAAHGARIRFVEAGAGPALLFVHDALASQETYREAIAHLARSFRVIAPDLPGFGHSEKPDPVRYAYGYNAFADSLLDLVAALDFGRLHVCGHGMGGGVALALAARHPSIVHKLVLASALVYPGGEHPLDRAARLPLTGALFWRQIMGWSMFRNYLHGTVYAGAREVPLDRVNTAYANFNAPAARRAAHATIAAKSDTRMLVAHLPRIQAESLVVWGRDDRLAPVEQGRRLARALRARFEVIACGRCPPDEAPEAFASIVTSFLRTAPAAARNGPVS